MAKYLQIEVDNPCHEKWEQMQASPTGNFCNSCQKTVIDFTGMTDNQLMEYFTKHPSGVCGRVYTDQLAQKIEIPVKRTPWLKYFFGITLPAMLFSYKANAQRMIKKQTEQIVVMHKKLHPNKTVIFYPEISGRITGPNGETVPFASIMIVGTNEGIAADSTGAFSLRLAATVRFLEVTAVGYKSKLVSLRGAHTDVQLNIALNENIVLPAACVRSSYRSVMVGGMSGRIVKTSRWNRKETIVPPTQTAANPITLFPNPAKRNGLLTIRWKNPVNNDQQINLYNASGVRLLQKVLPAKQPLLQTQLSLDLQSTGYYLIELIDTKTHEKQVVKLIVE